MVISLIYNNCPGDLGLLVWPWGFFYCAFVCFVWTSKVGLWWRRLWHRPVVQNTTMRASGHTGKMVKYAPSVHIYVWAGLLRSNIALGSWPEGFYYPSMLYINQWRSESREWVDEQLYERVGRRGEKDINHFSESDSKAGSKKKNWDLDPDTWLW